MPTRSSCDGELPAESLDVAIDQIRMHDITASIGRITCSEALH